nr:MAG TPA: hypothetical protein [Caudoviricetes sp.]DAW65246.1 MAG TPA: hypothetical protein [Caudoviricetes sp.]
MCEILGLHEGRKLFSSRRFVQFEWRICHG